MIITFLQHMLKDLVLTMSKTVISCGSVMINQSIRLAFIRPKQGEEEEEDVEEPGLRRDYSEEERGGNHSA